MLQVIPALLIAVVIGENAIRRIWRDADTEYEEARERIQRLTEVGGDDAEIRRWSARSDEQLSLIVSGDMYAKSVDATRLYAALVGTFGLGGTLLGTLGFPPIELYLSIAVICVMTLLALLIYIIALPVEAYLKPNKHVGAAVVVALVLLVAAPVIFFLSTLFLRDGFIVPSVTPLPAPPTD